MQLNPHYAELNESYLFSTIAHKVADYQKAHPDADIIRLGIGDVTLPLAASVTRAMHDAVEEQAHKETFHGYIPSEQGYGFLREAIRDYYADHGVTLDLSEIFVSDGAKSDLGNLLDLFSQDNTVLVPDPVYPVYVDDNVMAGRKILYLPANAENNFLPMPDAAPHADIVYLCSPNNPTGATYTVEQLKAWVRWAKQNDALILFDAAYECFVTEPGLARSIYEVEGAKEVAVEVCSFSKIAGFTGTRCGYTVVPQDIRQGDLSLNKMWLRRQTTKFNGVAYVVQRGAAAVFTPEGMREIRENLNYYRKNAAVIAQALDEMGIWYCGGKNSPYIWLRCPNHMDSWAFFDWLLENANVVGTPGEGFGACGQGYFRLTAFGDADRTKEAAQRIKAALAKL
ncbi:MAG: LL-diaminopimelate aminotransferase [Gemmiger sp.]|nr:LL-diaminopimelate aminotransferase [Gemmiger sp.]